MEPPKYANQLNEPFIVMHCPNCRRRDEVIRNECQLCDNLGMVASLLRRLRVYYPKPPVVPSER